MIIILLQLYLGLMNISMELLQSERFVQLGLLDVGSISKICPPGKQQLNIFYRAYNFFYS